MGGKGERQPGCCNSGTGRAGGGGGRRREAEEGAVLTLWEPRLRRGPGSRRPRAPAHQSDHSQPHSRGRQAPPPPTSPGLPRTNSSRKDPGLWSRIHRVPVQNASLFMGGGVARGVLDKQPKLSEPVFQTANRTEPASEVVRIYPDSTDKCGTHGKYSVLPSDPSFLPESSADTFISCILGNAPLQPNVRVNVDSGFLL